MTHHEPLSPEEIGRLTLATEPWLPCDDCFDGIDTVIEDLLSSSGPMPDTFQVHLRACPACHEEALALATLIAPEHGLTSEAASSLVDAATGGA